MSYTGKDKILKDRLNIALFSDEYCQVCGCHQTHHGWWIEHGEVRCHNCKQGIAMAQTVFSRGGRLSNRLCYHMTEQELEYQEATRSRE